MNVKTLTMTVMIALLATTAMPVAAAHWRTTGAPNAWTTPHEHTFALHSGNAASAYSGNFQRLCFNPATLSLTWGTQNGCNVPVQGGVFPPARGASSSTASCSDVDGSTIVSFGVRNIGISSIVLDWGATAVPPFTYNFADWFAHPNIYLRGFTFTNPTGATPAGYPVHVATVPGTVQTDITYIGLGWDGSGTSHRPYPGVDAGDNDLETCIGGASHTYAINSGNDLKTAGGVVAWAGAGLNDPRNIGGDLTYDVTPGAGGASPVVHTGGTVPATAALGPDGLPVGALLRIAETSGNKAIPYTVCNGLVGQGCTNIPQPGSGLRLGNGLEGDAVYSSLQDCVYHAAQTDRFHGATGRGYSGVQAFWGTATPFGVDGTCWPERLVRSSPLVTSIYVPSSQTGAGWNPDKLPATYREVEVLTIFIDEATMQNFDGFNSGCPTGTSVTTLGCFSPTFASPTTWFDAPNTITGFSAIFQP